MHFESIEDADHAYFGQANDEFFMNLVKTQLVAPISSASQDSAVSNVLATLTSIAIGLSALAF